MGITLIEIENMVEGELHGGSPETNITNIAEIPNANASEISFVGNPKYYKYLKSTQAGAVILPNDYDGEYEPRIQVQNPSLAVKKLIDFFHPPSNPPYSGVHDTAIVDSTTSLGRNVTIGPHSYIGPGTTVGNNVVIQSMVHIDKNCVIGSDCSIYPNVSIYERGTLGDRVIIHAGTVVGSDGYGFVFDGQQHQKIRQVGNVRIENDVEIGSNCSIDRATLGETVIGEGSKLDNMIQIGHNVKIGKGCLIVAQVGISGSTQIGDFVVIGGQAGIGGHLKIGEKVTIASQAGVTKDIEPGMTISGFPAIDHFEERKQKIYIRRLPELFQRLKSLELNIDSEDNRK